MTEAVSQGFQEAKPSGWEDIARNSFAQQGGKSGTRRWTGWLAQVSKDPQKLPVQTSVPKKGPWAKIPGASKGFSQGARVGPGAIGALIPAGLKARGSKTSFVGDFRPGIWTPRLTHGAGLNLPLAGETFSSGGPTVGGRVSSHPFGGPKGGPQNGGGI